MAFLAIKIEYLKYFDFFRVSIVTIFLFVILMCYVISELFNGHGVNLNTFLSYLSLPLLILTFSGQNVEQFKVILKYISLVCSLFVLSIFLFNLIGWGVQIENISNVQRLTSSLSVNALSFHIAACAIFATLYLKHLGKAIIVLFSCISLYLILLTGSRTGLLSYLIAIVFIYKDFLPKNIIYRVLIVAPLSVLSIYFLWQPLENAIFNRGGSGQDMVLSGREIIWGNFFEQLTFTNIAFGYGSLNSKSIIQLDNITSYHNSYLQLLAETGVFGFLAFIFILILIFTSIYRTWFSKSFDSTFIGVILFYFMNSFTESRYFTVGGLGSIVVLLSVIYLMKVRANVRYD
ncbi:hypothetical protein JCM19241_5004 [Vibrio ishigakensis]|uniref:O-antigen ligase-related domain-containing protein n=1 Tax=Vibrio ishigakensis TaxID=1481914 RepID=A0A0B8QF80_9VIBR|nr:hypothetical protein JCM19241_5004 [Vibrio ishigakensis]